MPTESFDEQDDSRAEDVDGDQAAPSEGDVSGDAGSEAQGSSNAAQIEPAKNVSLRRRRAMGPDKQTAAFRRAMAFGAVIAAVAYIVLWIYAHPEH
jgi:hypothetical protein